MKKYISIILAVLLIASPCYPYQILHKAKSLTVWKGTVTGLTISAVDGGETASGGAFVDNLPSAVTDLITANAGNLEMQIYDASNRMLKGVLKELGTSEGLGAELTTGAWSNGHYPDTSNGYDIFTPFGAAIIQAIASGAHAHFGKISLTGSAVTGALHKVTSTITIITGDAPFLFLSDSSDVAAYSKQLTSGANTFYGTVPAGTFGKMQVYQNTNGDWVLSGLSVKQQLTPSAAGSVIVSAKGGSTYNFSHKNASFAYNAASYYCIIKLLR